MSDLMGTNDRTCDLLHDLGAHNQSAYGEVDNVNVFGILPQKCIGYIDGVQDKTLSGYINLSRGMLRFDSMKNPIFWLEADLQPPLAYKADANVVFDDVQNKLCDESKEEDVTNFWPIPVSACRGRSRFSGVITFGTRKNEEGQLISVVEFGCVEDKEFKLTIEVNATLLDRALPSIF